MDAAVPALVRTEDLRQLLANKRVKLLFAPPLLTDCREDIRAVDRLEAARLSTAEALKPLKLLCGQLGMKERGTEAPVERKEHEPTRQFIRSAPVLAEGGELVHAPEPREVLGREENNEVRGASQEGSQGRDARRLAHLIDLVNADLVEETHAWWQADELAHADEALPEGTRIYVAGHGRGAYVRFG